MRAPRCWTICRTAAFFHATGGSVNMQIHERLKLMPYETLVGLAITFISTLMFGFFGFAG